MSAAWVLAHHRIQVGSGVATTAARALIEARLGVETEARFEAGVWAIYFFAPKDIGLDFLRPDVLPPR